MLENLINNPKRLLLIDCLGALLTATMLGFVLPRLHGVISMPDNFLHLLSGIAFGFALYSLGCHLFVKNNWRPFLLGIMILNTAYCLLSLGIVFYLAADLGIWDFLYFGGEILIVMFLVSIERRAYLAQKAVV